MNHLTNHAESYARHFLLESHGYRNKADKHFSRLVSALDAHTEAVSRSSVVAYREGLKGIGYNPAYQPWEAEAWQSGRNDYDAR